MNDHQLPTFLSGGLHREQDEDSSAETPIREIHALEPPPPPPPPPWEARSHVSSNSLSMASDNFTTMSREFNALLAMAGSAMSRDSAEHHGTNHQTETRSHNNNDMLLGMIGEGRDDEVAEETNPLAIVHQPDLSRDMPPLTLPERAMIAVGRESSSLELGEVSVQRLKEVEIEAKIKAWQNAKVAKINNRFKREETIIGIWENAQVERASGAMMKVERKLEEKRAKALEKMHNDIAKARREAEEKRASAEARRGTKVGKVFEVCKLMRELGRYPSKRSFF